MYVNRSVEGEGNSTYECAPSAAFVASVCKGSQMLAPDLVGEVGFDIALRICLLG